jgi:hypothetical protein
MNQLKKWLGIAKPGGLDDFVIRVTKTALAAFGVYLTKRGLDNIDAHVVRDAIDAGWMAGGAIVLNALALLAPGPAGQKTGEVSDVDTGSVTIGALFIAAGVLVLVLGLFGIHAFGLAFLQLVVLAVVLIGIGVLIGR